MKNLSNKQKEILNFLKGFYKNFQFPPTIREIAGNFNISCKAAYDHLKSLENKGFVQCGSNQARAIRIVNNEFMTQKDFIDVPILGHVAAGTPLLAEENRDGTISLSTDLVEKGELFALRVEGDSMMNAGILNGDLAVIKAQQEAANGEIVVALINDSVTLKRIYREKNRIRLQAENPDYSPIYSRDVRIVGKLCTIIRSY